MAKGLQEALRAGEFVVTSEIGPPKGTDVGSFREKARLIKGKTHAVNVTDNQRAVMRLSSLAAASILLQEGVEPVYQLTCRDRNRLALQSDLLGAWALGIHNVLALTGDHVSAGDHAEAKPVFDLDATQLVKVIATLNGGKDMKGNSLTGKTDFFIGAALNPGADPQEVQLMSFQKKLDSGARFFQTQGVFDVSRLEPFTKMARANSAFMLVGIMLLKSPKMAKFVNEKIPGAAVPAPLLKEMEKSGDPLRTGVDIAARLVKDLKGLSQGAHIMTMDREDLLSEILERAGL